MAQAVQQGSAYFNMRMKNFYCESNPQRQAYDAGDALWDSLRPKR
jgi:hypothetical protein